MLDAEVGRSKPKHIEGSDWLVNGAFCSDTAALVLAPRSMRRSRRERDKARRHACRRSGHSRSIYVAPPISDSLTSHAAGVAAEGASGDDDGA